MKIDPIIKNSMKRKLVGKKRPMSFLRYTVNELWKDFLSQKDKIKNKLSNDYISMTIYKPDHFTEFDLANEFDKWAVLEVSDLDIVPDNMETFVIPKGLYAVFHYKGASTDNSVFEYIFKTWLPSSNYVLDNRPHFEVLGEKYKNNSSESEEEIWIPIKLK